MSTPETTAQGLGSSGNGAARQDTLSVTDNRTGTPTSCR